MADAARKLDIPRLLVFIAVCEEGSISAAARRLHLAQPAVTVAINKLESLLEARLLERGLRGVTLTPSGRALLARAYDIVGLARSTAEAIGGARGEPEGEVSVGLPSSSAAVFALPLIERLSQRYPRIRLRVVDSFSGYLWGWVNSGELDMALVFDQTSSLQVSSQPLAQEDLHLVGQAGRLKPGAALSLKAVARHPLALPSPKHGIRRALQAHFARHGVSLVGRLDIDGGQPLIRLIKTGAWFSLLAPCAVAEELAAGELIARRLALPFTRSICLAQRRGGEGEPAIEAVKAQLRELACTMMQDGRWPARWTAPA